MRQHVDFTALAAPGVRGLRPYIPGKPTPELQREYGVQDIIKLASNENPLGPPAQSLSAIRDALSGVALYPDGAAFELKRGLAAHLGIAMDCITVGNGSNEILSIIAETFLSAADEAVYSEYAFVVYELAVQAAGAVARIAPANPAGGEQPYGHSLAEMMALLNPRTRLVFIANPNNPTGTWLPPAELQAFIGSVPQHVLVVVDEAYLEYMPADGRPDLLRWLDDMPNLIVCRTFSKMYGLAGLRIGYAVSHPEVAELLNRVRQPFNVNSLAQVAALAALGAEDHVRRSQEVNLNGLRQLRVGLAGLGWSVPSSAGNFVLADTGGPAAPWYEGLLRAGVIVRPVGNYGLPHHLRITVGLPEQNERLLRVLGGFRRTDVSG
ncbi:MAG: histidinol-phosphate transaminase [Gammaproteobacteria bacterium]|nr:histidinol-phosphate transaminase [Gammaproteobacteria bacterium]